MAGTFTALWVYVLATILGGVAAALLHKYVVAAAIAPTIEHGDPQDGDSAGDRSLATAQDSTPESESRPCSPSTPSARRAPVPGAGQPGCHAWLDRVRCERCHTMRGDPMLVIVLVLTAAAVAALGLVLLRKATQAEPERPEFSLSLLWLLIRHRPVWAAGITTIIASFVLQVIALASGPVSAVQLLVVMELPFVLILSRLILGGQLRIREWSAITAMTLGVAAVLLSLSPSGGDPNSPNLITWLIGLAATTAVITGTLVAGRWTPPAARTALAGIAAGVTAGLIAVLAKTVASAAERGFVAVLATWQTWTLLVVGAAGFILIQNAMQAGRLVASQPGITLANPLVAVAWGVGPFHEQVRTGWWLLGAGLGATLLAGGAVLLSSSPLLEGQQEAPDDDTDDGVNHERPSTPTDSRSPTAGTPR